jgi:spore maturation protein CgeB
MKFVFLTHSLVSDWNHGNAHFQRGVMTELIVRGHEAIAAEPEDGWSRSNLVQEEGAEALDTFAAAFPDLESVTYAGPAAVEAIVDDADVVVVHEWTDPAIVARLGRLRARGAPWQLLFHDTHHRAVSAPHEIDALELDGYDAVLAFGAVLAETYRARGWARDVHVWHEAADVRRFHPAPLAAAEADLVWIGNWGDDERAGEIVEFLVEPAHTLRLSGSVFGVRYPPKAIATLEAAGLAFRGRLPNWEVPATFARHRVTLHVPRRPYTRQLPGIPTIRVFEALACGIPLVSAPWDDTEGLFRNGTDYEMRRHLRDVLEDPSLAAALATAGRARILAEHTCGHRVDALLAILAARGGAAAEPALEGHAP